MADQVAANNRGGENARASEEKGADELVVQSGQVPHRMRITSQGSIKNYVQFALQFLQTSGGRPLILHSLPITFDESAVSSTSGVPDAHTGPLPNSTRETDSDDAPKRKRKRKQDDSTKSDSQKNLGSQVSVDAGAETSAAAERKAEGAERAASACIPKIVSIAELIKREFRGADPSPTCDDADVPASSSTEPPASLESGAIEPHPGSSTAAAASAVPVDEDDIGMALITDEVDPASTSPPRDGIPEGSRERQNSRTSMLYQYNKVFCLEDMALSAVARTSTNPEDAAEDQAEGQQTAVDMDGQVQSFKRRKTYDPQAKTTADGGRVKRKHHPCLTITLCTRRIESPAGATYQAPTSRSQRQKARRRARRHTEAASEENAASM